MTVANERSLAELLAAKPDKADQGGGVELVDDPIGATVYADRELEQNRQRLSGYLRSETPWAACRRCGTKKPEPWLFTLADGSFLCDSCRATLARVSQFTGPLRDRLQQAIDEELDRQPPTDDAADKAPIATSDFYYVCSQNRFIFRRNREMWAATAVNKRVPPMEVGPNATVPASDWIGKHRPVEQLTWAPGEPELVEDRYIAEGGWFQSPGARVYNTYLPPLIIPGNPSAVGPWLDHLMAIYEDDAEHIVAWLAHRVQRPAEKLNHALVFGGAPGIGKDTLLEPVKYAVGPWNWSEVGPTVLLGRFNTHLESVVLRVSEARDLGEVNRFALYEHMKSILAAPPDILRIDRKNVQEYAVPNVVGVIITTNHRTDGLYLPPDDRRHYVCWSIAKKEDFGEGYWRRLWQWYQNGGIADVAAYLAAYDLSKFRPKAPPPKTEAFWAVVEAGRAPEESELSDALDALGNPPAVTIDQILQHAAGNFAHWLQDPRNARAIPHRFEEVGYVSVRNPDVQDKKWKVSAGRRVIYARHDLSIHDQIAAARRLVETLRCAVSYPMYPK